MKIGVDAYCFHRFFGEVYPGIETTPDRDMTLADVVQRVAALGATAISLEDFMVGPDVNLLETRSLIERSGLELIWSWGHPDGLGSGDRPDQLRSLKAHINVAEALGARVMRVCAGGRRTRNPNWLEHKEKLMPLLTDAGRFAARRGIRLAVENHMDFTTDELVELIECLGMQAVGICLDTGNQIRMGEDPAEAIRSMAPYALLSHFKDVAPNKEGTTAFARMPSVPIGAGLLDVSQAIDDLDRAGFAGVLALEIDYLHPDFPSLDDAMATSILNMRAHLGPDRR